MNTKKIPFILFALLLVFLPATSARADGAPPESPITTGISPYFEYAKTYVRMYSEKITMEFVNDEGDMSVEAIFSMVNMGTEPETMGVMFPLTTLDCYQDFQTYVIAPESFYVTVNGEDADYHEISTDSPRNNGCTDIRWAQFEATFPVEQSVMIYISYMMKTEFGRYGTFDYILETGAGWYGTIGKVDIYFNAPFDVTSENFRAQPLGYQVADSKVHWHWEELEPTEEENITLNVWSPEGWQELTELREFVRVYPDNAQGWYGLGSFYSDLAVRKFYVLSSEKYSGLAIDALSHAIQLDPTNSEYRRALAYVLIAQCEFTSTTYSISSENVPSCQQLVQLLEDSKTLGPGGVEPDWIEFYTPTFRYFGPTYTTDPNSTPTWHPTSTPTRRPYHSPQPTLSPVPYYQTAAASLHAPTADPLLDATAMPQPNTTTSQNSSGTWIVIIIVSGLILVGSGVYLLRKKISPSKG